VVALRALEKRFGASRRFGSQWRLKRRLRSSAAVCSSLVRMPRRVNLSAVPLRTPTLKKEPNFRPKRRRVATYDRLLQAYPIHPEVFDRLYEDWTTIDGFQRTRVS